MSFSVRDGSFDVALISGPRVSVWPSPGVHLISAICNEAGLKVGVFGGEAIKARGVVPVAPIGGIVLAEDIQRRIYRIQARAIVKTNLPSCMPDPFSGWRSSGLIPISTANRLKKESLVTWSPATAILGTGNSAFRFGSMLLDEGVPNVYCIETVKKWGRKSFAGWEVERRRFEIAGGTVLEARPVLLKEKAPLLWEFHVDDGRGIRVLEVARVVSAGPFSQEIGVKEYPPGSFLFELDQTAPEKQSDDVEGWLMEEERARLIACGIIKALSFDIEGAGRERLFRMQKRARARLNQLFEHRNAPFVPVYQGKFISRNDSETIRALPGVPKKMHVKTTVASVECPESVLCSLCEKACPNLALRFSSSRDRMLVEENCRGCGACVAACPAGAIVLINEREGASTVELTLRWSGRERWAPSQFASLLNRRGEVLASGRVLSVQDVAGGIQLVKLAVPMHLAWEARGIKKQRGELGMPEPDSLFVRADKIGSQRVEILLDGEKRLVRDRISVSVALFEIGKSRQGDVLLCSDSSCGLCDVVIDGVKRPACKTEIHRGMALRLEPRTESAKGTESGDICSCLGISKEQIQESVRQGRLQSVDGVVSITHFAEGRCHGQVCSDPFKRLLCELGIDASQWIDWRFPWSDWRLIP